MPKGRNQKPLIRGDRAEEYFSSVLQKQGFRIAKREVQIPAEGLRHGPRFDFLVARGEKLFAVQVKAAKGLADWLFHWVARPILALQAGHRLRGWEPLLGIYVRNLEPRAVQRFRRQANVYAPDLWWIIADARGNMVSHLPDGDEEQIQQFGKAGERASWDRLGDFSSQFAPSDAGQIPPRLSFGDLDQWLIKVLLFAPSQVNSWGGPRGSINSLLQLAKLAEVSPPLVYRWAVAMEVGGYLKRRPRRAPVLRNLDALIGEWRGRYRLKDNELLYCKPAFAQPVDESYAMEILQVLRGLPGPAPRYALSGHQACRFHRVRHSSARSIHLYVQEDSSVLLEALQLAPDRDPAAPVVLLRPRYLRSVFRGAGPIDGIVVCDALQVYLDLYHLRDRGREQADFLYDQLLRPLVRTAAEQRNES